MSVPACFSNVTAFETAQKLKTKFGDLISEPAEFRGEITLRVSDADRIVEICDFAKKELGFDYLVDISSVDNYGEDPRWTVVYHLRGLRHGNELRIKTDVSEETSELPTITTVWKTANWHEREIYDMMGIRFQRSSRFAPDFDVGRLSIFPVCARTSRWPASRATCPAWRSPSPRRSKVGRLSLRPAARTPSNANRACGHRRNNFHGHSSRH